MKKVWVSKFIRISPDLAEDIISHVKRTGLKEQELLREAIRLGLTRIEEKPTI